MRVLTFLHSFEAGGVERIALRLVRQWRSRGVDAPLFVGRDDGDLRQDVGAGLEVIMPCQPGISTAAWETLWMIVTLPKVVRDLRPDILFCAGNTYAVVAVALKLLLGRRCPPIVAKISNDLDRRDQTWWQRLPYRLWLKITGRVFDHVVGMEQSMFDEICEGLAIPSRMVTIIPDPALSTDLIGKLRDARPIVRPKGDGRRFVAVGRLAPQKNVALMLRAFERGRQPDDRLTIIGDGPERRRLEVLASRLGLGEAVAFRGYVSEPAEILPDFDILLLSSNYEGVPAVILEALAARLLIIATDCSRSMAALLREGLLGELVPVGDERQLAAAISRAPIARQNEALSLAQAERFTVDAAAERYVNVMTTLRRPLPLARVEQPPPAAATTL
jgi:glycosyltransferase involved in cell wall biosynthesis